jgi:zinc transport system permease protein
MIEILQYDFAQRAVIAAVLIGLVAPIIGVFLVQRRLALLGDGTGHVALTGVGLAIFFNWAPIPMALLAAAIGAISIEIIRDKSKAAGDLALALMFYGGIAGGVMFVSLAPASSSTALNSYLFGSLTTASNSDLLALFLISFAIIVALFFWGRQMFAVGVDTDVAKVLKIPVRFNAILLAILSAGTVVVGMRVVGLLLVSAIMIVPVAAAQQLTKSFKSTMFYGSLIGLISSIVGLLISFSVDVPPGPTIVILALLIFVIFTVLAAPINRRTRPKVVKHEHEISP